MSMGLTNYTIYYTEGKIHDRTHQIHEVESYLQRLNHNWSVVFQLGQCKIYDYPNNYRMIMAIYNIILDWNLGSIPSKTILDMEYSQMEQYLIYFSEYQLTPDMIKMFQDHFQSEKFLCSVNAKF